MAVPVAASLAAIAWLQQAANDKVGEAVWLYLGAGLALASMLLSGIVSVATTDGLLALIVMTLVGRELLGRRNASGRFARG